MVTGGGDQHVTEQRAPTDESVRLLREMERDVEKRVMKAVMVSENDVNATWWISDNGALRQKDVYCRFLINGEDRSFHFLLGDMEFRKSLGDPMVLDALVFERIVCELGEVLKVELFRQAGRELMKGGQ